VSFTEQWQPGTESVPLAQQFVTAAREMIWKTPNFGGRVLTSVRGRFYNNEWSFIVVHLSDELLLRLSPEMNRQGRAVTP